MQCFGGCFATQADPAVTKGDGALAGSDITSGSGKWAIPAAGSKGQASYTDVTVDCQSASSAPAPPRSSSKSKLRLLSSKSSKQLEGPIYTPAHDTTLEEREQLRQQYAMQHGRHILGVSTLQQEQLHHFVMPGIGYIAYAWMDCTSAIERKVPAALSDPVCDRQHYRTMADAFLREHPNALFVQVSFEFASILQTLGFTCNSMGGETRMNIATYNFTGYARRGLRSAISAAQKDGITVEEVMNPAADTFGSGAAKGAGAAATVAAGADWAQLREELVAVEAQWAANKAGNPHDVWFINRPPVFAPEAGVRKFVARNAAGAVQGFIFFDGVFEDGQLTGYYANITRLLPDAHPGTLNLIVKEFLERVRSEAQLSAPKKNTSMRKSQRKKLEAAAAAAAAAAGGSTTSDTAPILDQQQSQLLAPAAAAGPKFLSLGLSPFYQMNNKPTKEWKSCPITYLLLLLCYEDGAGFYPFKTLAAAKAKYGAGLHSYKYEDPNVEYRNAFLCHRYKNPYTTFWRMFDLATLYGFWAGPTDCFSRYFGYKGKQSAAFMARALKKAASLDTYKPKKCKKKKKKLKKTKSTGSANSFTSTASTTDGSVQRSKSAPAGSGTQGRQSSAKALKFTESGPAAAAAAGTGALGASGRTQADASSQIPTALQPPAAWPAGESSSDAASLVSANPSQSPTASSEGNTRGGSARFSISDSDNA